MIKEKKKKTPKTGRYKFHWLLHFISNWENITRVFIVRWINSNIRLKTEKQQDIDNRKTSIKDVQLMGRCRDDDYENSEPKK